MPDQNKSATDDEAALARLKRRIDDLQGRTPAAPSGPLADRKVKDADDKG